MINLGLAFGGGGARGAAHAGILYELDTIGLKPDLITGTSIGAVVAALAAFSKTPEEIHQFFTKLTLGSLYNLPGKNPSLSSLARFESVLVEMLGRPDFSESTIPFSVVATNLSTRQEVVLGEGDVVSAVMASMAFPILLPPVERNGLLLVDGGLVNNVPFDVARARGATVVIAVDLGNSAPYGSEPTIGTANGLWGRAINATKKRPTFQVMTAVTDIITERSMQARMAISPPDLLIRPLMNHVGLIDFDMTPAAVLAGRQSIRENPEMIEKLRQWCKNPPNSIQI
ncbi:MAG: NTE family protein [Cellvibrionaceae bacterium]|jgi:NTE family protein